MRMTVTYDGDFEPLLKETLVVLPAHFLTLWHDQKQKPSNLVPNALVTLSYCYCHTVCA